MVPLLRPKGRAVVSDEFQPRSLIPNAMAMMLAVAGRSWLVHVFDEGAYRAWTLFPDETVLCVACGVLWRDKFEVIERRVGPGIPRVTKNLLRNIERCLRTV